MPGLHEDVLAEGDGVGNVVRELPQAVLPDRVALAGGACNRLRASNPDAMPSGQKGSGRSRARVPDEFTDDEIRTALGRVEIPGRLEVLSHMPYILFDACMTRESAVEVRHFLIDNRIKDITLVLGLSDDKDYAGVAEEMSGLTKRIILTTVANPHYICSTEQETKLRSILRAKEQEPEITRIPDINEAIIAAKKPGAPVVMLALGAARGEILQLPK